MYKKISILELYFCRHIQHYLNGVLEKIVKRKGLPHASFLTEHFHMWPDFHGNRSPLADPTLLGMVRTLITQMI